MSDIRIQNTGDKRQNTGDPPRRQADRSQRDGIKQTCASSFKDLIVWKKAHEFVLEIYRITSAFPANKLYRLQSQVRRAVVSIAANIAEGFVKRSRADKIRYFNIAQGSLEECKYYLILVQDLH